MTQRNNLRFKKTNRGKRKKSRIQKEISSANRRPIVDIRRKRNLLKEAEQFG